MRTKKSFTQLLAVLEKQLEGHYKDQHLSKQYAVWLIERITGKKEISLITQQEIVWTDQYQNTLEDYLEKLTHKNMPLQYLLGSTPFANLEILCKPPILIPRPETEEWCMNLIEQLKPLRDQQIYILDLCTGSGCIALALAQALPKAIVYGTDSNEQALSLARQNALHNRITNATFLYSDLFCHISPTLTFDVIVGNPPYIPAQEWPTLDKSVAQWEDKNALIAEDNGLALIKNIIRGAPDFIRENNALTTRGIPQLMLEIDYTQGAVVAEYMKKHGYYHVMIHKDLEGKDRVASGSIKNVAITKNTP